MTTVVAVVAAVVLVASYVTWTAQRLDRLHARVDAAWSALDAQLVRRAAAARALVPCLPPGPDATRLERAAVVALGAGPVAREAVENDLTAALTAAVPLLPDDEPTRLLVGALETATSQTGIARQLHNTAVQDARAVRVRRIPRALHLAGHRGMPQHFDIQDAVPSAGG